jgi:hypothetical protein
MRVFTAYNSIKSSFQSGNENRIGAGIKCCRISFESCRTSRIPDRHFSVKLGGKFSTESVPQKIQKMIKMLNLRIVRSALNDGFGPCRNTCETKPIEPLSNVHSSEVTRLSTGSFLFSLQSRCKIDAIPFHSQKQILRFIYSAEYILALFTRAISCLSNK